MIYLIIGILILLFYVFAIPTSIKGTLNVLTFVLLLVALIILLALAIFQIFKLPGELFVSIFFDYYNSVGLDGHRASSTISEIKRTLS